ncbi:MAG: MFS transporter [Candidatus Bathyarchaeia archaeon]
MTRSKLLEESFKAMLLGFPAMWQIGFFVHEMAYGLLSVFIPLYIISIGGSLLDVGLIVSIATLVAIPASLFWGYICDKTMRYKRYILTSFIALSIILYLLTLTKDKTLFMLLYIVMSIFHVAHEPPKNVLISELYSRGEWEKSFAFYEGFTEIGWLIGLIFGVFAYSFNSNSATILIICSFLNFLAFISSIFLVTDPILILERGLVRIERITNFACRGLTIASKVLSGLRVTENLIKENLTFFCVGLMLFAFASSTLFTPLPIFLAQNLQLSTSMVYLVYVLNSCSAAFGYCLAGRKAGICKEETYLQKIVMLRSILVFLLFIITIIGLHTVAFVALILALMGLTYALYHIYALSISMELIPAGKAGLFDSLVSLGSAIGAYLGPSTAQIFGFTFTFVLSGIVFFSAYISFKASLRR